MVGNDHIVSPFVLTVVQTANQALLNNPRVHTGEVQIRPLTPAKALDAVQGWLSEGIPESVILGAVVGVCGAFTPDRGNPRIGSFRYFDAAIHKAWMKVKAEAPLPDSLFVGLE